MVLHGVYYWMLNNRIKQLPPWANQGLLAILWTLWGFACYYVALVFFMHVVFDFHFWIFNTFIIPATVKVKSLSPVLVYDFFMFNIIDWIFAFLFVAILSAKTGSHKLWFILFFAGFIVWRLTMIVNDKIFSY